MNTALAVNMHDDDLVSDVSNAERLLLELERRTLTKSLYAFVQASWHVVEPSQAFVPTWHVEELCKLLESITLDTEEQKRWIINIPPGTLKSLLINVFWPAWCWARQPQMRFLTQASACVLQRGLISPL